MVHTFSNGEAVSLSDIPTLSTDGFAQVLTSDDFVASRKRVLALWVLPDARIVCVLGNPVMRKLEAFAMPRADYIPLSRRVPALDCFEREIFGYPERDSVTPLKGEAAHEVAVGPVHAGVIEPGHFRFQCVGENVYSLEIRLGYQHRGAEDQIVKAESTARRLALAETVAGDTSVAAQIASAFALGVWGKEVKQSYSLMTLLLELERIANHVGDLGALSGDVAYLPTASFCGRIRGEYLNMSAEFTGNRFGRGALEIMAPTGEKLNRVREWFARTERELFHALDLLFSETSAMTRFEGTGCVNPELAREIGLTGVAGRASGLKVDARVDFPLVDETIADTLVSDEVRTGDVLSRARQRYDELKVSHRLVAALLNRPTDAFGVEETRSRAADPEGETLRVAVVEAWRGELVHAAVTGVNGLEQYKIFDPSFHNWFGLEQALRGEQISNFPICNKSFNLSYCGVDR